jgi:hypothetical protein
MILFARWGGLAAGIVALSVAWIASARARGRPPSLGFQIVCIGAAAIGLAACVAPHSAIAAPVYVVLVPATLAVAIWLLPALVVLVLMLIAARFFGPDQRPLRTVQIVALWFAFVAVPGFAGVGLISQYPICLG